jgi:predicted enzyme related to lactoylglutathione lyase
LNQLECRQSGLIPIWQLNRLTVTHKYQFRTFPEVKNQTKESNMEKHNKINYIEFPARDLDATKAFFTKTFGWSFEDYGSEYLSFTNAGIAGGFFRAEQSAQTVNGSALIVLYSNDLEQTYAKVADAGGAIIKQIFSFPGGRRFHFTEPSGNEFAVWSE